MKKFILFLLFLNMPAGANICEKVFGLSGLSFRQPAVRESMKNAQLHPHFRDPIEEQIQQTNWDQPPDNVPRALNMFLPEGTHFIGHQLPRSESATSVKLKDVHGSTMVRAAYEYKGQTRRSNVLFSSRALLSNIYNQTGEKWLVRPSAQAVILFLHGMGMQTAGAHIAKHITQHFKNYKGVEILSLDLPFHGEGPRTFLNSLKEEVLALSAFAQKYIPPHVPLFVMAHSGGTVFAQKLMSMTDGPQGPTFFHPSLKGIMLFSPIVDSAPGRSPQEKYRAFSEGQKKGLKDITPENNLLLSTQHFESRNPVGELYGMWNIVQWDAIIPFHGGKKDVPTLMAVGTNDPLVFTGFPKSLFHKYYDQLSNMETHYLQELPHLKTKRVEPVGHWLGEYRDSESDQPLQVALARPFMEKQLGEPLDIKKRPPPPPFVQAMELFSHDLAFRSFLSQYSDTVSTIARLSPEMGKRWQKASEDLKHKVALIIIQEKSKLQKRIHNKIFQAKSSEEAIESINQMNMPEHISSQINQAILESPYFDLKAIVSGGLYLPSKQALLARGLINPNDKIKVDVYLEELSQKVREQSLLTQEIKTLKDKRADLVGEWRSAWEEVKDAIFLVERGIKQADEQWPSSLNQSFRALKQKRDEALKAREQLVEIFEEIASSFLNLGSSWDASQKLNQTGFEKNATSEIVPSYKQDLKHETSNKISILSDLYKKHSVQALDSGPIVFKNLLSANQRAIDQDRKAYQAYQQARQSVQQQVIQEILSGEIGDIYQSPMYQKAARDLYGLEFNVSGEKEPNGPLYVRLKNLNQELAETESHLHTKTVLFEQGIQEYQNLLSKGQPLFKPLKGEELDLIALAESAYMFYNVQEALQTLVPVVARDSSTQGDVLYPTQTKDQHDILIDRNGPHPMPLPARHYVFQRMIDIYQKQFRSDLIPSLPGF